MSTAESMVSVTVTLPKAIYERVAQAAAQERRQVEELLSMLVAEGLDAHASVRELFEQASDLYRSRLAREGKPGQTSEEILNELRDVREQIARELYP